MVEVTSINNFGPRLLTVTVISTYIGFGSTLSLSKAITVLMYIDLMKAPLLLGPFLFSVIGESRIAMAKIEAFFRCKDSKKENVSFKQDPDDSTAIEISNASFSWDLLTKK